MPVRDMPGFVVNRVVMPMINEAATALQQGVADARSIDECMKLGCNHPMGPLALADLVGLDVVWAILDSLHREFGQAAPQAVPRDHQARRGGSPRREDQARLLHVLSMGVPSRAWVGCPCDHRMDGAGVRGRLERIRAGGAPAAHEKLAAEGKLFARERIARLLDADSFVEDAVVRQRAGARICPPTA